MAAKFNPDIETTIDRLAAELRALDTLYRVNNKRLPEEYFIQITSRWDGRDRYKGVPGNQRLLAILTELSLKPEPKLVKKMIPNDSYSLTPELVSALRERGVNPLRHIRLAKGTEREH